MPPLDKETHIFLSIAERPSNFGCTVHNAAFRKEGINAVYLPRRVTPAELPDAIAGLRGLAIRGCGVSMPHKTAVMQHLDWIAPEAQEIKAVNTIVNVGGKLHGFNTDWMGALRALQEGYDARGKRAYLLGTGGAARALIVALRKAGCTEITILGRNDPRARELAKEFGVHTLFWERLPAIEGDLLVNATSVGLNAENESIVGAEVLRRFKAVMDVVVVPPETTLIRTARELGLITIPGYRMALYQAGEQFRMYTQREPPWDAMKESIAEWTRATEVKNMDAEEKTIVITGMDQVKTVTKPWGYEKWITGESRTMPYSFKKIFLKKGSKTSLQYHERKTETNLVYSGRIRLHYQPTPFVKGQTLNILTRDVEAGTAVQVHPGFIHRVEALEDTVLFEASTNDLDDVVRLEDSYHRKSGRIDSEHESK